MRRYGWTASALFHLLLGIAFLLIHISVRQGPFELSPVEFANIPESASNVQEELPEPPIEEPEETREIEQEETPEAIDRESSDRIRSRVGVREGINWISGPPDPDRIPIEISERTGIVGGPIRRALASVPDYSPLDKTGVTAVDTLLFIQERLEQIATEVMEEARKAPKGGGRIVEPIPVPGSIAELRGEPQLPVTAIAVVLVDLLTDLGKKAWDRLTKRDPNEVPAPDLDLTYPQVLAYAALDEHLPLSIFEWYSRLHEDFVGGLGELQQMAALLSDRGLVRMESNDQVIRYRRIVPLHEVIDYYSAFLNRLPGHADARKQELVKILSALVRIP